MPFDSSLPDEKCAKCGHSRLVHQEPTGSHKGQCGVCFEDLPKRLSKAWLHAFVPADAETAGEPETHPRSGYRDADEAASMYPEPEASDLDARWDAALGDVPPPEPEAPECTCSKEPWRYD